MLKHIKGLFTRLINPLAGLLLRLGVTPDMVTIFGTILTCAGALWFFPRGDLFLGSITVGALACLDAVDGAMARRSGTSSCWGAFLDSTLDRVADAAIFVGLAWWAWQNGESLTAALALATLIAASLVSYTRARAEGLNCTAAVGIAERPDRLVAALVAAGLVGLGLHQLVLTVTLAVLCIASVITIGQRMTTVKRQLAKKHPENAPSA